MRLAYADPPYPGRAELYADHPDFAGEVDHVDLIRRLETYDGWVLHTSSRSLRDVLELCPAGVRVLIWLNHNVGRSWEPILVKRCRPLAGAGRPLDWIAAESDGFQWRPKPAGYVIGRKPAAVCRFAFDWVGAEPGADTLADLFPGSGAVGDAWDDWNVQPTLPRPLTRWDVRRSRRPTDDWTALELDAGGAA